MIVELRVRDLVTIADVTLQLGPGLNVLTGETGAGKSMLIDALSLLLGERASGGSLRPGDAPTYMEACGRYRDQVALTTSGWLLAERVEQLLYVR